MGLAISTGFLADMLANDPEGAEWFRRELDRLNALLIANGLPPHDEPEEVPRAPRRGECGSFPYSYLHYLRRAVAYSRQAPDRFRPVSEGEDPADDPLIDVELSVRMDCHVVCHSDAQGLYVPVDFADILYGDDEHEIVGDIVGSSFRVVEELVKAAPLLGIELDGAELGDAEAEKLARDEGENNPLWRERLVWFAFFEAASRSVRDGTAIVFC